MIRISITPVDIHPHEAAMITAILNAGWDYVHLRHPQASVRDVRSVIEDIPMRYHNRLRLHGHFELTYDFNPGGLHLNHRCPTPPPGYQGPCSRSCHSIAELSQYPDCDYLTLSPIFDSLSKPGYNAAFTREQLRNIPTSVRVVALGGVTPETVPMLADMPFAGYATLGYLWQAADVATLQTLLNTFPQ